MSNYNHAGIMGRLTADPQIRAAGENKVANYTLAVDRTKDITDFIDCVAWNQKAEFVCSYFGKGDLMIVEGPITTRMRKTDDGKSTKYTEIKVNEVYFAGGKNNGNTSGGAAPKPAQRDEIDEGPDSNDPPF